MFHDINRPMRHRVKKISRLVLGSFLTVLLFGACVEFLYAESSEKKGGPPASLVEVSEVIEKEVLRSITLVGTGEAWLETVVAAEEDGLVSGMRVEEGDQVEKNQLLCEQDPTQLLLRIEAAKAELAEAEVIQAQTERDRDRQKRLFAINSVAEKAYEDAQFSAEAATKKVARLRAMLLALEDQMSNKKIKAPVSGFVVERHCVVGQWLKQGEPAITMIVRDPILFMVPVPEKYVPSIRKGEEVPVTFDALPKRKFTGKIDAVIQKADTASRTFPVRIKIPNPEGLINPGMLGRATLPVGNPHKALLVPKDALVLGSAGKAVYIVIDGKALPVPVEAGSAYGSLIEVKGDLRPGQKVVIRGNERLRPGLPVKIKP